MLKIFHIIKWLAVLTFLILILTDCAERNPIKADTQNSGNQTPSFWKKTTGPNRTLSLITNSQGHIFAGTEEGLIAFSLNGGQNWTQSRISDKEITRIVVHPNGSIYAISGGDIFISTDNGINWTTKGNSLPFLTALSVDQNGRIYVGTDGGLYSSNDLGENWSRLGLDSLSITSVTFRITGDIFAATTNGIYQSSDNGTNWTFSGLGSFWINTLAIDTGEILYGGSRGDGIFRSLDNGSNWKQLSGGLYKAYVNEIVINQSHRVFAGTEGGVYEYIQANNRWNLTESDPLILQISSLALDNNGFLYAASYPSGIYRSIRSTNP